MVGHRFPLLKGLRVIEWHPGTWRTFGESHGLHIHALMSERVNIHRARKLASLCGMGFIKIRKCNPDEAKYIGKYLTKPQDKLPLGMRAFGTIGYTRGHEELSRIANIQVRSQFADNVATWQHRLGITKMTPDLIHTIYMNTTLFGEVEDWPMKRLQYHGKNAAEVFADLKLPPLKRRDPVLQAKAWKTRGKDIMKKRGMPPEAKNFYGQNRPGDSPVASGVAVSESGTVTRLDIGASYWDKYPGKTDGTRIAYYRVNEKLLHGNPQAGSDCLRVVRPAPKNMYAIYWKNV